MIRYGLLTAAITVLFLAAQPALAVKQDAATAPAPAKSGPADAKTPAPASAEAAKPAANPDDTPSGEPDPALKPVDFTRDPFMSPPKVSPDGTHIAWVEGNSLVVYDPRDQSEKDLPGGTDSLDSVDWINNDDLVVYLKSDIPTDKTFNFMMLFGYSPLVVSKEGKYIRPLFAREDGKFDLLDMAPVIRFAGGDHPYAITYGGDRTMNLDIATGKRTRGQTLMQGDAHYFDVNGLERLAVDFKDGKATYGLTAMTFRYRDASGKTQTLKLPRLDKQNIYYINFTYSEADNGIYWTQFDYTAGTASIYRFDIATGAQTLFRTGPDKDMEIVLDQTGKVVGVKTWSDRDHTDWTDPAYMKLMTAVQKLFPSATVDIVDMSDDGGQAVFLISAPETPDAYYQYNAGTRTLVELGTNYPELDGQPLAPMTYITYKARDGLDIPAYLTRRADTPPGAPLIVFPHGGPAARDQYGFDYEAQYFASKGYVVLQPEYRGSAGFGDAFERAGNLHLAQMTTDLEDGVRVLAAQGTIDPKKVCVVGWSWGGYLAQAALAFTPGTYACGISGDGVSDLMQSFKEDRYWGGHVTTYWRTVIGGKGDNADLIHATSPIEHVDQIKAPLLLIHGAIDPIVDVEQSQRMNAAMQKAGKDVTYVEEPYMMHGPDTVEERLKLLRTMDDFIAKAFGIARPAKPAEPAAKPAS